MNEPLRQNLVTVPTGSGGSIEICSIGDRLSVLVSDPEAGDHAMGIVDSLGAVALQDAIETHLDPSTVTSRRTRILHAQAAELIGEIESWLLRSPLMRSVTLELGVDEEEGVDRARVKLLVQDEVVQQAISPGYMKERGACVPERDWLVALKLAAQTLRERFS